MFLLLQVLLRYWIENFPTRLLYVKFIFCTMREVPNSIQLIVLVVIVPWINHFLPVCYFSYWKSSFKQLVCTFDMAENSYLLFFILFIHIYIHIYIYIFTCNTISCNMLIPYFHLPYFYVSNNALFLCPCTVPSHRRIVTLSVSILRYELKMKRKYGTVSKSDFSTLS